MRIALITRRFPPECCGVGDFTFRLAQMLHDCGHEVVVFTSPCRGRRSHSLRIIEIPLGGWRDLGAVARAICAERPARVQIEYSGYGWGRWGFAFWVNALVLRLRAAGHSITMALHETYLRIRQHPLQFPVALLQRLHIALFLLSANELFVNTPERLRTLQSWFPWRRKRIRYRPNASNIPVLPLDSSARAELRVRRGADSSTIVVATFGNFAAAKNYQAVIEAVASLRPVMKIRLWMLGDAASADPRYIASLHACARLLGIEEEIFWPGFLPADNISAHLQAADLFVLPQADGHLTRSGAFMAAAAHGLPVIAVHNPANQAEFAHGLHVWLVARSRGSDFADAIRTLAVDTPRRRSMGASLHRLYEERFDWPQIVDAFHCSNQSVHGGVGLNRMEAGADLDSANRLPAEPGVNPR